MQFYIEKSEEKTSPTGKKYKRIITNGQEMSVWEDFVSYDDVQEGATIEGDVRRSGKFLNLVDSGKTYPKRISKDDKIKEAQDRNKDNMSRLAIERDATNFVVALIPTLYKDLSEEELRKKRDDWRKWLSGKYNEPFI